MHAARVLPALRVRRYLLTGLLTFIPVWITWTVFKAIFALLSEVNLPWVVILFEAFPDTLGRVRQSWLVSLLAFATTLITFYLLGFAASRVLGQRLLGAFERVVGRIPVAHAIYGGSKKLLGMLQSRPGGASRVVLIDFPSPELKSLGFVTREFRDADGVPLAAVYVPTTPNPTGGYLEIVPVERLVATDWSVDQAMAFILSAGAAGPDRLPAGAAGAGPGVPVPTPPGSSSS
jgi:uncharacterized membrane protein